MTSCSDSAKLASVDAFGQRQGHVDASRDAGAADVVALPDDAVGDDVDAHRAEGVAKAPSSSCPEQPGGGVEARAGTLSTGSREQRAQPVDQHRVAQDGHRVLTAGHDDQVRVRERGRQLQPPPEALSHASAQPGRPRSSRAATASW